MDNTTVCTLVLTAWLKHLVEWRRSVVTKYGKPGNLEMCMRDFFTVCIIAGFACWACFCDEINFIIIRRNCPLMSFGGLHRVNSWFCLRGQSWPRQTDKRMRDWGGHGVMRETADQWKSIFVDYQIDRFSLNSNQRRHERDRPDGRNGAERAERGSEGCVRSDETNLAPNGSRRRVQVGRRSVTTPPCLTVAGSRPVSAGPGRAGDVRPPPTSLLVAVSHRTRQTSTEAWWLFPRRMLLAALMSLPPNSATSCKRTESVDV